MHSNKGESQGAKGAFRPDDLHDKQIPNAQAAFGWLMGCDDIFGKLRGGGGKEGGSQSTRMCTPAHTPRNVYTSAIKTESFLMQQA